MWPGLSRMDVEVDSPSSPFPEDSPPAPFSRSKVKPKFNLCTLALRMLDAPFVLTSAEEVLAALGKAVERAKEQLTDAEKTGDADFVGAVTDEVCSVIEQLLGAAFVVCQAGITRVVSRVDTIRQHVALKKHSLSPALQNKAALMKLGTTVGSTSVSEVAAIDAFANSFKHESEWSKTWANLKEQQARTARTVAQLGAKEGSSGNLRTGAEVLGNADYSDMSVFANIVERWRADVQRACAVELKNLGLIA
jgi:hypothetical protein